MRQRDKSGRIVSNVVCGRRFCTKCGKWRHLLYFRPRRAGNGREYPNSPCDACHNRSNKKSRRQATGSRRRARKQYENRYYRDYRSPYPSRLDGQRAAAWLDKHTTYREEERMGQTKFVARLNGVKLEPNDRDLIKKLRAGKQQKHLSIERADELCSRYDLPLWELQDEARLGRQVASC